MLGPGPASKASKRASIRLNGPLRAACRPSKMLILYRSAQSACQIEMLPLCWRLPCLQLLSRFSDHQIGNEVSGIGMAVEPHDRCLFIGIEHDEAFRCLSYLKHTALCFGKSAPVVGSTGRFSIGFRLDTCRIGPDSRSVSTMLHRGRCRYRRRQPDAVGRFLYKFGSLEQVTVANESPSIACRVTRADGSGHAGDGQSGDTRLPALPTAHR